MTYLALTGLINAITNFTLGLFVFYKNPRGLANRAFLNICLSVTLYSIGYFLWQMSSSIDSQIFWFKVLVMGVILINPAFLHFVFAFTEKLNRKKNVLFAVYAVNIIFMYFNSTSLLYTDFVPKYNLGLWPVPSFLFHAYLPFWFLQVFYGFVYFLIGFKESTGHKRKQITYCIIAGAIGFVGGATNWPMWYDINIPPYLNILITAYALVSSYAIVRHRILDIEVVIKKTLVYAGLFTFAFGVIVGVAMLTQELLSQFFAVNRLVSLAISAVIIIFSLRPLENFLVNATNKYLFQKKYDPRKILKDFADEVLTILNLDRVCKVTVDTLVKNLYLRNCTVLLTTPDETGYEVYNSYGLENKNIYLANEDSLVNYFKRNHAPVLYQSYDKGLQASGPIKRDMYKIQSQVCMPLVIHDQLVGILSLGAKKSDQPYTKDDVDILTTLVRAVSIAISNARLFVQAAQYEKLAAIGTLASGINHEVCNPLNNISAQMQIFIESRKRGIYKDKTPEQMIDEAEKIMHNSIKEIQRVAGITTKLSSFAKPSKEHQPKPISMAQAVDDALSVVGHDLELNKVKIIKNIPSDLPKIIADEHQIQQIFFNLFRNAAQAIKEGGTITVGAEESENRINIKISDTGCGIAGDKLSKIFEPFYTTKEKGSGFGLSIVRELIWRNNGNISVDSKVGEGTTFHLEFPKA